VIIAYAKDGEKLNENITGSTGQRAGVVRNTVNKNGILQVIENTGVTKGENGVFEE
jgi:hypothetical protein